MTKSTSRLRRLAVALLREDGITMIVALGVMLVTSTLLVAVFTATRGETHLTSTDTSQKKAYYAAEAGVQDYEYHLTQDGNYLSYCTEPPSANPALNQYYKESTAEPLKASELKTAEVPGTGESYAIQFLPAESAPEKDRKCDKNNLVATMLEEQGAATGTFRIESTGFYNGQQRSLVATFRNANFVSFVWYTKYETFDPVIYGEEPSGKPTYWNECEKYYGSRPSYCSNNYFIAGESVNGPLHTEDHAGVCGSPIFGRTETDRIEFRSAGYKGDEGYSSEGLSCGGSSPKFQGNHIPPAEVKELEPPPGDEELLHVVEPSYLYEGKTEIVLGGSTMTVIKHKGAGAPTEEELKNVAFPPNGVIYIEGSCAKAYSPYGPIPGYGEDTTCGNVYVHGNYTSALTIAAQNDVIINGSLTTPVNESGTPTSNAMLGLVANNFVRLYHPVSKTYTKTAGSKCKEGTYQPGSHKVLDKEKSSTVCEYSDEVHVYGTESVDICDAPNAESEDLKNPTIYAAILALKHAFVVDNFACGSPNLEKLNVYGAIAGLFSNGLTGVFESASTMVHGYPYNANYDNRLQIEEPPHFLNPIEADWYIQRETLATNP
jgi:Tfp pilus assembly protein PilX